MSPDERVSSNIPVPASASIPRPPPLPAPRPLQRARDAANRFFGYPSRPMSPQGDYEYDKSRLIRSTPTRYATLGATQNATATHKTGLEINTVSINEKGTHALIGGKEIFKTVRIEDGVCAEDLNLRTAIRSAPRQASGAPRQVYSVDIADVAWAKGDCGDYVAAATSSGKIILYDLGLAGLPAAQLHEHFRQVHKVTFNPHRGNLLLSGSQDGTVRLWDLRDIRHQASQLQSKRKYSGQSDGVRDVKWSPTDGVDFAFGTDSGWVQRWDIRNLKTAKVKIPAHTTICNSVDWHPDGKHLASGSSDKTVRVWDVSTGRRQKAGWEIKTPYSILNARWRPACESSMPHDNGARLCTQLVTAYSREYPTLHIWDFRRPALPFREITSYTSAPTDMLWHSQDLLWTVGREGTFMQSDIQHAPKVMAKRHLQAFAVSPQGDVNFITQQRRRRRRPSHNRPSILPPKSYSVGHSPEQGSYSRSWADDSLDQSFLSFSNPKHRVRSAGSSRAPSISQTPPSQHDNAKVPIIKLDDVLSNRKSVRPLQYASRGKLPGVANDAVFAYLAEAYEDSLDTTKHDSSPLETVEEAFDRNTRHAEAAGLYQLAQTWRIARFATTNHLKLRAEARRKDRLEGKLRFPKRALDAPIIQAAQTSSGIRDEDSSMPSLDTENPLRAASILSRQLAAPDSASNVTTPLARPCNRSDGNAHSPRPDIEDPETSDHLALPPSLAPRPSLVSITNSPKPDNRLTAKNLGGLQKPQWTDGTTSGASAIRRWSVQPKVPLSLDPVDAEGNKIMPKLEHHDSDESFSFLEGSFESRGPSLPGSFASNESAPLQMPAERPSRGFPRVVSTEATGFFDSAGRTDPMIPENVAERDEVERPATSFKHSQDRLAPGAQLSTNGHDVMRDTSGHSDKLKLAPNCTARLSADFIKQRKRNSVSDTALMDLDNTQLNPAVHRNDPDVSRLKGSLDHGDNSSGSANAQPFDEEPAVSENPDIIPSDFESHRDDSDVEEDKPFTLLSMFQELLSYYANTAADVQIASQLLLLLGPLLPHTHQVPTQEATLTDNHYTDAFGAAGFSPGESSTLLTTTLTQPLNAGLQPLQLEAILSSYHDTLLSHRLFGPATALRKQAYPAYPAVYEQALKDNFVSLRCGSCSKPIDIATGACEKCGEKAKSCAICWCAEPPFQSSDQSKVPGGALWSTCLLCNHSNHAACVQAWFGGGGGGDACPTEGCLCACVPGAWREEKVQRIVRRPPLVGSRGKVKSDEWGVGQSRAVEAARGALVGGSSI